MEYTHVSGALMFASVRLQTEHGQWTAAEAGRSSTWRELRAVRLLLGSLVSKLAN